MGGKGDEEEWVVKEKVGCVEDDGKCIGGGGGGRGR